VAIHRRVVGHRVNPLAPPSLAGKVLSVSQESNHLSDEDLRRLSSEIRSCTKSAGHGIYLGRGWQGWCYSRQEDAVLVIGPPRSGKTSSIIVPAITAACGAAVSTSTKPEVMENTFAPRRSLGRCFLFDPTGSVEPPPGVQHLWWSPVSSARHWDRALGAAHSLVATARPGSAAGEGRHWTERAESLLAPLLHAAALMGLTMREVVRWVNRREPQDPLAFLIKNGHELPADLLYGITATDQREQSGIWSTASEVLAVYRSSAALASAGVGIDALDAHRSEQEGAFLDPDAFVRSCDTIYICATGRDQQLVAPLIVNLLDDIRAAAYRLAVHDRSRPPILFALDEIANIAPIPDLPSLVSEGGGQGVVTLACMQDLTQAYSRWGAAAEGFFTLFGTKVILPGVADTRTLETLSTLAGTVDVASKSVSAPLWWSATRQGASATWSIAERRVLPPEDIARARTGEALVFEGASLPVRVELTPYFATDPWRQVNRSPAVPEPRRERGAASREPERDFGRERDLWQQPAHQLTHGLER
jgi:type IV secretion system protein VirD4